MANTESSVTVSLRQLQEEEEERRKQEVFAAHRRQLAAERLEAEERARTETEARRRVEAAAEAARQTGARQREEQVRLEAMREAELERARIAAELEAKLAVIAAERARDEERFTLEKDRRIERRTVLASGLGLLVASSLLGSTAYWLFVVRPTEASLRSALASAERVTLEAREQASRQSFDLKQRLDRAERHAEELERALAAVPKAGPNPPVLPKPPGARQPRPGSSPPMSCPCHERDPLCEC